MKKILKSMILIVLTIVSNSCINSGNSNSLNENKKYQCPMDCENGKIYDKPGTCPVCGMDLKEVEIKTDALAIKSDVNISGAMMNVMHKGELFGTISLDTISNKTHLFGLGPLEYLKGEVLIIDGKSFISKVASDNSMTVAETYNVKAPFFVYQNVEKWEEVKLADTVQTIPQLESFLDLSTKNHARPFAFKLKAIVDGEIHIVNLPTGTKIHSPEEAHQNQKTFSLKNESVDLIGFFSSEHQGVFTHHDNFTHIHLITSDQRKMGHLDELMIKKGTAKLFLPKE